MSVKNPVNSGFTKKYKKYALDHKLPNAEKVVTNDPMEATYVGINMWKQAVEKAGTTNVDKVRISMGGQTFDAPSGYTLKMDEENHHLWKPVMIGQIRADGQFDVISKTPKVIRAEPWSQYIPK